MKKFRKSFYIFLLLFTFSGGAYLFDRLTEGFSKHQITSKLPVNAAFELTMPDFEEQQLLSQIFDQPFHYLGKGCQCYAFVSDDGYYVLKFFKHKHLRSISWLKSLPFAGSLRKKIEEKVQKREERVVNLFSSCKLAYAKMPELTGLVFLHLNRTPCFNKKVILKDKLGISHRISLDEHEFILQRKAIGLKETLSQLKQAPSEVRRKIQQLIALIKERYEKRIGDTDPAFVQNVAFSLDGSQAIFVDIGRFFYDPGLEKAPNRKEDFQKRVHELLTWTNAHFPTLFPIIEEELAKHRFD